MLDQIRIDVPAAAAVFRSARQRSILLGLVEAERSLSELSKLTGTRLNLLHHHVQRLLRLGLVKLTRTERRAGAPIKRYRAVARSFFVPAELMGDPRGELTSELRERMERSLASSVRGALYSHTDAGPRMRLVPESDRRVEAAELWLQLRLTHDDAAALSRRLRAVLHQFHKPARRGQRSYLVHLALAPDR
jgi:hypothetical protein